jgi:hypothetical protein
MKPEIEGIFSEELKDKVSSLLENLSGMTEIIEVNLNKIKELIQKHKEEDIKAINLKMN